MHKSTMALTIALACSGGGARADVLTDPASAGAHVVSYAIPTASSTRFVSPAGRDGAAGTAGNPWATIGYAAANAPAGGTVVVAAGTYREGNILIGRKLTVQPQLDDQVLLTGAVVLARWAASGNSWVADWAYHIPSVGELSGNSGCPGDDPKCYLDGDHPEADRAEFFSVDGVALKAVLSRGALRPGTFFVDDAARKVYIGTDPSGRTVEGATSARAINIYGAAHVTVRGLRFEHYYDAAISIGEANTTIDNVTVRDTSNGMVNACCQNANNLVIKNSSFFNGGFGGPSVSAANNATIQNNVISGMNARHFNAGWSAGGSKVILLHNSRFIGNLVTKTTGNGLWCDVECNGVSYIRNLVVGNSDAGIIYEISKNGIIAGNVVARNGGSGVFVSSSNDTQVWNNTITDNVAPALFVVTSPRDGFPENTTNTVVENNLLVSRRPIIEDGSAAADPQFNTMWQSWGTDPGTGTPYRTVDYNGYVRAPGPVPTGLIQGWQPGFTPGCDGCSYFWASSIADARFLLSVEAHGLEFTAPITGGVFVNEAANNFALVGGSGAIGKGTVPPAAIGTALKLQAGKAVNLGALQ